MILTLQSENGNRWMSPDEQFRAFPTCRELQQPYMERPVWLVLSIVARELGFHFRNDCTVSGQMRNIREAVKSR